jgi:hypothetical protein
VEFVGTKGDFERDNSPEVLDATVIPDSALPEPTIAIKIKGPPKSPKNQTCVNGCEFPAEDSEERRSSKISENSRPSKSSVTSSKSKGSGNGKNPFKAELAWNDPGIARLSVPGVPEEENKSSTRMASKQSAQSCRSRRSTSSSASSSRRALTRYGAPKEEIQEFLAPVRTGWEPDIERLPEEKEKDHDEGGESALEEYVRTAISLTFMILVGLSMPALIGKNAQDQGGGLSPGIIVFHVIMVSILMILGKMFPVFCYRDEAKVNGRTALCLGMCPRGEVGASIIVISLELGITGPAIIVAMCALGINLVMSGGFIACVKFLLRSEVPEDEEVSQTPVEET